MGKTLYDYCIETGNTHLLQQWDGKKNGELSPKDMISGSHKKAWWICDKGHSWESEVRSRVNKLQGCPFCANRKVVTGENDLATTHPEIAAQWHPTLNGDLRPDQVVAGNYQKVWWRCEKGHEWQAIILSRTQKGTGCPVCNGKQVAPGENDLASAFPDIAVQWHPTKNGDLSPDKVTAFSNCYTWWLCDKGHEYRAMIGHRTNMKVGCPYCTGRRVLPGFNDLQTVQPKIASQWHPTLNGDLTPQMVTSGSKKKVWWQCSEGHVWHAVISSRTGKRKTGCPVCAGKYSEERQARYVQIILEEKSKTR